MEAVGVFLDEEWESLSRMLSTEEADFMVQLHGHDDGLSFATSSTFWPTDEVVDNTTTELHQTLFYSSETLHPNFQYFSQESSNSSGSNGIFFPTLNHEIENYHLNYSNNDHNISESMDFCMMDKENNSSTVPVFSDDIIGEDTMSGDQLGNVGQLKRKFNTSESTPKKKLSRVSRNAPKSVKNAESKKNQKLTRNGEEETNGQSSCCYSSEDDSNASQELSGRAINSDSKGSATDPNLKGKTRATRGSATDPQSLYARKRRERINERLRILQSLVPNGTKVDISTMLEEAVHYVKFMQLQIKLLSSDDMWMYAPIAYNGVDIGLYRKISPSL